MAERVRVGLIGAGGMANRVHYPSLAEFEDVEMVALCDLVPDKLKATAEKFGIPKTYSDYRAMLDGEERATAGQFDQLTALSLMTACRQGGGEARWSWTTWTSPSTPP